MMYYFKWLSWLEISAIKYKFYTDTPTWKNIIVNYAINLLKRGVSD